MKLRTALLLVGLPLGFVALGLMIPQANAQTNSWINSNIGFWQDASSWSLGLPNTTQSMLITNAGSKTVFIESSTASGYSNTLTVGDLILAGQAGSMNMLLVDNLGANPPLHILNSLIVNPGGALLALNSALLVDNAAGGSVDVEGAMELSGTNFLSGGLYVGFPTNSAASVSVIDGQTTFTNGYMTIGFYGSAQVNLLGGTLQTEDNISAPNGMFLGLGPASQGTLSVLAATALVPEHLSLGEDPGSTGRIWVNGGQVINTNNYLLTIGGKGVGQTTISNGLLAASYLIVADSPGSFGTMALVNSTMDVSGAMVVAQGQSSTGSVFITSGQLTATNQSVSVGGFGIGQMTLSNSSLLAQNVIVGDCENSQGAFTIDASTVSIASNLTLGARSYLGIPTQTMPITNANALGTIQIKSGSLTVTNQYGTGLLAIGQQGNGAFVQNGGLVQVDQCAIAASSTALQVFPGSTNIFFAATGQAILSNGSFFTRSVTIGGGTNCHGVLSVAGGTVSVSSNILVGISSNANGVIQISGGNLYVTNQSGTAQLVVGLSGIGTFAQTGGVVTVDQLLVTNGTYNVVSNLVVQPLWSLTTNGLNSAFNLGSGVFNARSATISNPVTFVVGDGVDAATYHLLGGVHSFANGIEVTSNAVLSGCGTINGSVFVDAGGTVLADCGGTLTFTGIVTNNGTWTALHGSTFESYGPVVNNGLINIFDGNTNFHSGFVNNGIVFDQTSIPRIVSVTAVGSDIQVEFTTVPEMTYILEYTGDIVTPNWTPLIGFIGPGGNVTLSDFDATQQTQRYYRVHMTLPQTFDGNIQEGE